MRVLKLGGDLNLTKESFGTDGLSELIAKHLEGDFSPMTQVVREIYRGHATRTELPFDVEAACESSIEALDCSWRVRQWRSGVTDSLVDCRRS